MDNNKINTNKEWFTISQTAKLMNCSIRNINRLIASRQLERRKVNGLVLIHRDWINRLIMSNGSGILSPKDERQLKELRSA